MQELNRWIRDRAPRSAQFDSGYRKRTTERERSPFAFSSESGADGAFDEQGQLGQQGAQEHQPWFLGLLDFTDLGRKMVITEIYLFEL